jgi:hypothetical protein
MASVITFVAGLVNQATKVLLEIDELSTEKLPDGRLRVVFVTSGVHPTLAQIKTVVWSILGLPVQMPDEVTVEELQSGSLVKRYRVTVVLKPVLPKII